MKTQSTQRAGSSAVQHADGPAQASRTRNNCGASENTGAISLPQSKMKPPSMTGLGNRPEERKFGRQLSTNNGEANAQMSMLSIAPDSKSKPNVKAPTSSRGLAVDRKATFTDSELDSLDSAGDSQLPKQPPQPNRTSITKAEVLALVEENPEDVNLIKPTKIETNPFSLSVAVTESEDASDEEETKVQEIVNFSIDAVQEIPPIVAEPSEEGVPVAEVFKQRLAAYRKQLNKQLNFADQMEARNPQLAAEFASDIYHNLRADEIRLKVSPSYLQEVQNPKEIKDTSRAFLVEWIIDVHRKFRLVPETLYVTVFLIDRFLSLKQIKKNQLHILGVSSLLISTKYEEIYPPELKDLLSVSENKFTRGEVLSMERDILLTLQFDVTTPSAYRFLERYRRLTSVANDAKVFFLAQYIQEISLLDASLLNYNPSEIAAASLILSVKCLKKMQAWNREMEKVTGYSDAHLAPIVEEVKGFALEVNPKFLTTLKYKFSKQEYMEVASIALKF